MVSLTAFTYPNSKNITLFVTGSFYLNFNTRFPKPGVAGSNPAEAAL